MSSIEVEEVVALSMLYDFYGALLKENKRKIFEAYVMDDYSLGEIAKEVGMSRQGVHDTIRRCTRELKEFEAKLGLLARFQEQKRRMEEVRRLFGQLEPDVPAHRKELFERACREIEALAET